MGIYSTKLAQISAELSEQAGDAITKNTLAYEAFRLRLGAVRVCVLGQTGAGKSTLINALLGQIMVPESGNTSSPVPVWFTYGQSAGYKVYYDQLPKDWKPEPDEPEVKPDQGMGKDMRVLAPSREKFIKKYCFNTTDIARSERSRYNGVKLVTAEAPAEVLEGESAIIDTLGISATEADTAKTIGVLNEGVDVVIFVTQNENLQEGEVDFLLRRVFGKGKEQVAFPLDPSRLLVVLNNHSPLSPNRSGMEKSLEALYKSLGVSAETSARLVKENLFVVRALQARLADPGVYDYVALCPEGTRSFEIPALERRKRDEESLRMAGEDYLVNQAGEQRELWDAIMRACAQALYGPDSGARRYIERLRGEINSIRAARNKQVAVLQQQVANVQRDIQLIRETLKGFETVNDKDIPTAFQVSREGMLNAIQTTLAKYGGNLKKEICGEISEMLAPEGFDMTIWNYGRMNDSQKDEFITQWIERVFYPEIVPKAAAKFRETVMGIRADNLHDNYTEQDTVKFWVEDAKNMMLDQGRRMRALVQKLEGQGASEIGVQLPTEEAISAWSQKMASDIEVGILEALLAMGDDIKQYVHRNAAQLRGRLKGNLWQSLKAVLNHRIPLWPRFRDDVLAMLGGIICDQWTTGSTGKLYNKVFEAYNAPNIELTLRLKNQSNDIARYLNKLEGMLSGIDAQRAEVERVCKAAVQKLNDQENRLNALRQDIEKDAKSAR